ncbi:YceI family protein [Rhodobacteraceae bacterium DSL-40]|uniref:YceI family protein n=1 Tax=Amaricoccus sp. B4 TaxID=3368557 RepID=UPI000DAC1009
MSRLVCTLLLALSLPVAAGAAEWRIDRGTQVSVDVPWRGGRVEVRFPTLSGTVDFDEVHPERAQAAITARTGDATTGIAIADSLLRGPGYLETARYPSITFRLDRLTPTSKQTANVEGRITLRGVTKPVSLDARVIRYAPAKDNPKRFEAGFAIEGSIDRTEFGSTAGLPEIPAELGFHVQLLLTSDI